MSDTITKYTHRNTFEAVVGLLMPIQRSDNYGNYQSGKNIYCSDGNMVQTSWTDLWRDTSLIAGVSEYISGSEDEYDLGGLPSPLETRCQHAAREISK